MASGIRKHNIGLWAGLVGSGCVHLFISLSVGSISIWTDAVIMGILIFFSLNRLFIVGVEKSKTISTVTHSGRVASWWNSLRKFFVGGGERKRNNWTGSLHGY